MGARVATIIQRKDGTMLIGTAGYGMYTINDEGYLQPSGLFAPEMFYNKLMEDSRGRLWQFGYDESKRR